MLSYWEKQSLLQYDMIVVGSGIVGLSTAVSIKEKSPKTRVLVLERAVLPTGASTKNAGFACIGSLTEILEDLKHTGEDQVLDLVQLRYEGLKKLRERLGDKNIRYASNGSYELIKATDKDCLNELDRMNDLLFPILKTKAFTLADEKLKKFGFPLEYATHLISNNTEGELHTGEMMRALIDCAIHLGIEIKTGCEVIHLEGMSDWVQVVVQHHYLKEEIPFTADKVVVCTNAFAKQFYPEMDLKPGRGQVLITEPMENLPFKGIFHFDKGFYYFRNIENRVLFGGGRNKDVAVETTTEFAFNEKIREDLLNKLRQIILPEIPFVVSDWWTGIMAFGEDKVPIVEKQSDRIFAGVRMGGMGVAIGSAIGEKLAYMMLK